MHVLARLICLHCGNGATPGAKARENCARELEGRGGFPKPGRTSVGGVMGLAWTSARGHFLRAPKIPKNHPTLANIAHSQPTMAIPIAAR